MITQKPLPYSHSALEPHMSEETLNYHYDKHHKSYVDKLNELIKGTKYEEMDLVSIIKDSDDKIFNNAAQIWNHDFFWQCLSKEEQKPSNKLTTLINKRFESFDKFKEAFTELAVNNFGSGWTWLVLKNGNLEIINTSNAMNPLVSMEIRPLLTLDIWEHAYYIDHRNERKAFIDSFWSIVNWSFVEEQLNSKI